MVQCDFAAILERDMDVLFAEAFATDSAFLAFFLDNAKDPKTKIASRLSFSAFKVDQVELSKKDRDGESDITVTITNGTTHIGLLIEDKIDAPAQQEQYERYEIRGRKQFDAFEVFIVCPKKYLESNQEAQKYPHYVSYESISEYYAGKDDPISRFRHQQIEQAIRQARKAAEVVINETAHAFFEKYYDYVHTTPRYRNLDLRTSRSYNGYWPRFATRFGKSFIYHKMNEKASCVDYTFPNSKKYYQEASHICEWLNKHGHPDVQVVETGESVALRIQVPPISYSKGFEEQLPDLNKCFDAVKVFSDLAAIMNSGELLIGK